MNSYDEVNTWEDIAMSLAEVRSLLTKFMMLEKTVIHQTRNAWATLMTLSALLGVVCLLLTYQNSFSIDIREPIFVAFFLIAAGMVATFAIYSDLVECGIKTQTVRESLEHELQEAEYVLNAVSKVEYQEPVSTSGDSYAA